MSLCHLQYVHVMTILILVRKTFFHICNARHFALIRFNGKILCRFSNQKHIKSRLFLKITKNKASKGKVCNISQKEIVQILIHQYLFDNFHHRFFLLITHTHNVLHVYSIRNEGRNFNQKFDD